MLIGGEGKKADSFAHINSCGKARERCRRWWNLRCVSNRSGGGGRWSGWRPRGHSWQLRRVRRPAGCQVARRDVGQVGHRRADGPDSWQRPAIPVPAARPRRHDSLTGAWPTETGRQRPRSGTVATAKGVTAPRSVTRSRGATSLSARPVTTAEDHLSLSLRCASSWVKLRKRDGQPNPFPSTRCRSST